MPIWYPTSSPVLLYWDSLEGVGKVMDAHVDLELTFLYR